MRTFTVFAMLFLFQCGLFAIAAEFRHENRELTAEEKKTFNLLNEEFAGRQLDKDLKALRELAESPKYIDFLSEKYPNLDIKAFEDVANKVVPVKERYFKFFNEQFFYQTVEDIPADEFALIHKIATDYWFMEAIQRSQRKKTDKKRASFRQLVSSPEGQKWLSQQGIIEKDEGLQPTDWISITKIFMPLAGLVSTNQDMDFFWIKTLLEKHGESDGMLWVAVQNPVLFDRILYSFTTRESFLKRLNDPVHKRVKARFIPK